MNSPAAASDAADHYAATVRKPLLSVTYRTGKGAS